MICHVYCAFLEDSVGSIQKGPQSVILLSSLRADERIGRVAVTIKPAYNLV